jgi:hypothetical protein
MRKLHFSNTCKVTVKENSGEPKLSNVFMVIIQPNTRELIANLQTYSEVLHVGQIGIPHEQAEGY